MKRIVFISLLILILLFLTLNKCKAEGFAETKGEENKMLWDNKITSIKTIIENLKKEWKDCGFDDLVLEPKDFAVINSRKRLIELLPVTNMLSKLDYNKVRCFVSKFDPENYVVISKTIATVPKVLKPRNIIIVNNMLYQSTPYGVLKYQVPKLSELNNNTALNASIEAGILNDYNSFNMGNYPIYNLDGRILQKRGTKILDLKNNDEYEFTTINNKIELLNKKSIDKIIKDEQDIKAVKKDTDTENNKIKEVAKETAEKTNQNIAAVTKDIQVSNQKVKEGMVDIGGIVELNVQDVKQLKALDPSTFLPIVKVVGSGVSANEDAKKKAEELAKKAAADLEAKKKAEEDARKKAEDAKKLANAKPADDKAKKEADEAAAKAAAAKKAADDAAKKVADAKAAAEKAAADAKRKAEEEKKNKMAIKPGDIQLNKLLESLVSVIEYDGIIYICQPNIVRPLSIWANKLNEIIKKNKFVIKGVIPHYYYSNNKFNYVLIFLFNDDFCVMLNKEELSQVMDVKSVLGISFNQNIPDRIGCDDLKVILEQMVKANVVTNEKSDSILKRYKCKK